MSGPIQPKSPELRVISGPGASRSGRRFARVERQTVQGQPALGGDVTERRTFYVETYGCEMNQYDSDFIASRFLEEGYAPAPDPGSADVLLFNTCSVRQGAEDRVKARVRSFAGIKATRPDMVLGVVGCMAQRLGRELHEEEKLVDLVAGTDTYRDLPALVEEKRDRESALVHTPAESEHTYSIGAGAYPTPSEGPCAFLTIMQGCDKFCTFCIVPFTRGRERSKAWTDVVREAEQLVARGAQQITLLGQNVNSYRDGDVSFDRLLRKVDAVPGLQRLTFTSSYPRDMTDEVFHAIADGASCLEFLHFPVQSGSNRILKRMKRRHTVEWYVDRIDAARRIIPGVQFSSDLMVGFPGETEQDFQDTLELVRRVRYAECYMYKYSPREGTPALKLPDELPDDEKSRRLELLIKTQREIGLEVLKENLGREVEVLVEGPSKRNPREPWGRTRNRFMVVLPEDSARPGDLVRVKLAEISGTTYRGVLV